MLIDWTGEFDRWMHGIEAQAGPALEWLLALLGELEDLEQEPAHETAMLKRVRQARRHRLWRMAHPFDPTVAIRIIVWFPSERTAVVALMGFDKARWGDVWYASAAVRCEALVDQWLRDHGGGRHAH